MKQGILLARLLACGTQLCAVYSEDGKATGERLFVALPQCLKGPIEAGTKVQIENQSGRWYVMKKE